MKVQEQLTMDEEPVSGGGGPGAKGVGRSGVTGCWWEESREQEISELPRHQITSVPGRDSR